MDALRDALARPSGLLALSASALAAAIMDTVGFFGPGALALTTLSAALALAAGVRSRRETNVSPRQAIGAAAVLRLLVAVSLGYEILKSWRDRGSLVLLVAAGALLVAEWRGAPVRALEGKRGGRSRLWLWCACAAALLVLDLRARDGSFIDVWVFQQDASAALLRGEDPYSITYRNIYGDMRFYGEGVADASRVRAFPYPPQTILLGVPAFAVLGDVRYALLAALLVAALALARLAPAGVGCVAAAAVLFHPGTVRVLRSAWTEPALLAPLLLLLLAVRRLSAAPPRGWVAVGVAGALAAGAKQYSPLLLAPLLPAVPAGARVRATALAAGVAAAVIVPFAAWDAKGLWDGVVAMQFRQPFRTDALSWPAAVVRLGGLPPSAVWGFALTAAVVALTWPRRGSLAQAVTCGAAAFLVFLLGAKQAFLNYYWLAGALLVTAAVLQAGEEGQRASPSRGDALTEASEGGRSAPV